MMRVFWRVTSVLVTAALLVGGFLAAALSFSFLLAPVKLGKVYTVLDATGILFARVATLVLSHHADHIGRDEHIVLDFYGNSLIVLVSLAAIAFSTLAVRAKLATVQELLPYEKFDISGFWRLMERIDLINSNVSLHRFMHRMIERRYINLRVMKMVHFYRNSQVMLIVSGDYSWLHNSKWSAQAVQLLREALPHKVKLISHRTPRQVADNWKRNVKDLKPFRDIFAALAFTDPSNEYNGSVVRTDQTARYIYLYRETQRSIRGSHVCVFHGDREARALVRLVEDEFSRMHSAALDDAEREAEKAALLSDPAYFG